MCVLLRTVHLQARGGVALHPTTPASALPLTSHSLSFTRAVQWENRFVKTVLFEFREGHLAGKQLGGLEHNSKVNDLNRVAMTLP